MKRLIFVTYAISVVLYLHPISADRRRRH